MKLLDLLHESVWVRFWINSRTGQILRVPHGLDHDGFIEKEPELFGEPTYDHNDFETEEDRDAAMERIYERGWSTILFDEGNQHLNIRADDVSDLLVVLRIITRELPVAIVHVDLGGRSLELDQREIKRFLRYGKLK